MSVKLEIPDSQLPEFKRLFADKAYVLLNKIRILNNEFLELKPILEQLGIELNDGGSVVEKKPVKRGAMFQDTTNSPESYNTTWTWGKKSKYIIEKYGAQTALQIIDKLMETEPSLSIDLLKRSIPATLSMAATAQNAEFKRDKNDKNEWVYDIEK